VRPLASIVLALFVIVGQLSTAQTPPAKLVVILVVDQMRADYVDRFEKDWTGGLKRLVRDGAVFTNAAYPYLSTVTCVGHATIATGVFPRTHGMIANGWWDRDRGRGAQVTCTEDPRADGVSYGAPIKEGDSGWRLQRPTFADRMRTEHGSHVVSLSLKARSAVMLAGHGGDAVTWISEASDGWMTSSVFAESPVPAVKAYLDAHPIAADFGKTWTRALPDARYPERDDGESEAPPRGWTRTFPHVLTGTSNAPDATFFTQWERSPFADAYLGRFAAAMVDAFALGKHDTIDLLAVSFSSPDLVGHAFGPNSQEVRDLYVHLDRTIGALLDHLDETVGRGRWTLALSADHGITSIPEQSIAAGKDAGRLSNDTIRAVVEQYLRAALGGTGAYVAQATANDLYLAPGVYDRLKTSPRVLDSLVQTLRAVPGIARVFRSEELRDPAVAVDPLQRAAAFGYFPGRSGDLILIPKPGWMFSASGTTHGTATPDDQRVPLVFFGAGVKPGRYGDAVTPADLVPTLAASAGLTISNVDSHVLKAALLH
jgi:arylsulfatase A-like enzyme